MECQARVEALDLNFVKNFGTLLSECDTLSGGYVLPLTPPLSPANCYDSATSLVMDCDCHRLQAICPQFADPLDGKQKLDSIVLKDIMWGYGDIRPTACGGPAQLVGGPQHQTLVCSSVNGPLSLCCESNKLVAVDPTEVFPMALFDRLSNLEQTEFDDESDIDVVTVDNDDSEHSDDVDSCGFLSPPKTPEACQESMVPSPPVTQVSLVIPVTVNVARVAAPSAACESHRIRPSRAKSDSGSDGDVRVTKCRSRRQACLDQRLSRASHNVLERRRRNELKEKFYCLRDAIPGTKRNEKVPKVNILRNAIRFIAQLERDSSSQEFEIAKLQKLNVELKQRLLFLLGRRSKKEHELVDAF